MGQYRRHSAEFKAKVALEAIKGQRTLNEIAGEYGVHPRQIIQWKKQVLEVYLKDYEMVPSAVANLKDNRRHPIRVSLGEMVATFAARGGGYSSNGVPVKERWSLTGASSSGRRNNKNWAQDPDKKSAQSCLDK